MKIIINAASIFKGGAEQVANSFINECRNIPHNDYHIFLCDNIYKTLELNRFGSNFYFYKLEKRTGASIMNLIKTLQYFDRLEKEIQPDVVISTGGHGYWIPNASLVTGFNIPHYVYPESPYFDDISFWRKIYWKLKKQFDLFFYRRSDAIIVQTDDVNFRVKKLLGGQGIRVHTVSNTVNGVFANPSFTKNMLPPKEKGEVRLLTLSSNYAHKNLGIIRDVIDNLIEEGEPSIKFILTLPEEALGNFKKEKYQPYLINIGPVAIDQCPSLYNECDMMFLPTLLECFSASYAEAMAMGKPILTSDLPFAKTVCKEAAIYFDPVNPVDITDKIQNLIKSPDVQKELIQKGRNVFKTMISPRERAESFLAICESQVNGISETTKIQFQQTTI